MVMSFNDMRMRPYILPHRSSFSLVPRYGRRYEDDVFSDFGNFFGRSLRPLSPERILFNLDDLARMVTGFEDVPRKIKSRRQRAKTMNNDERERSEEDSGTETEQNGPSHFAVQVRAAEFQPEEIAVRVRDGYVTVEAEKEEKDVENGSYKYQQIRKRFLLPPDVDPESLNCEMTKDGYLHIQAQGVEPPQLREKEKMIPIKDSTELNESRETSKGNSKSNKKTDS